MSEELLTDAAEGPRLDVGSVVDARYRINGVLGRGGMGQVYTAEHLMLRRPVALKLLRAEFRQLPNFNARFEREAFAAGRVQHPNVVAITDSNTLDDGTTYLVMELLDGQSLGDLLEREKRVEAARALHIARHVLRGLAHAHAAGVVHRDIKPENVVLVRERGDADFAKILDFGIAKLIGDAIVEAGGEEITQTGFAIGSPTYMSPEQAIGGPIDGRTDLYSLSIVLYELMTGRPPFYSDDKMAVLKMHFQQPVPPASATAPDAGISPEIDALLIHGLAKQPEARIASAEQYIQRIDALLAARPPRPAAPPSPPSPPSPRRSSPAALPSSQAFAATEALPLGATPPREQPVAGSPPAHIAAAAPRPSRGVPIDRRLWIAGAVIAGIVLVLIAAVVSPSAESSADDAFILDMPPAVLSSGVPSEVLAERPELARAESMLKAGKASAVIDTLRGPRRSHPTDPHVAYLIGGAYFQRLWWSDGFDAYRDAIAGYPAYRDDPSLIQNAIKSLMSPRQHAMGQRFLVDEIGESAVPYLEQAKREADSANVRERAARVLERLR